MLPLFSLPFSMLWWTLLAVKVSYVLLLLHPFVE